MSRTSGVYRPSQVQRAALVLTSDPFPNLRVGEVVLLLKLLQFTVSEELLRRPTLTYVRLLYEQIMEEFVGVTMEELHGRVKDHEGDDLMESTLLVLLVQQLHRFLKVCGIADFSLTDVVKPDLERLIRILSAIINFARFREQRIQDTEEMIAETEESLDRLRSAADEQSEVQGKIKQLRLQLPEADPSGAASVDRAEQQNESIAQHVRQVKKAQEALTLEYGAYQASKGLLKERLKEVHTQYEQARESLETARKYMRENPEALEQANRDLAQRLQLEQLELVRVDAQARDFSQLRELFQAVEMDIMNAQRILDEVQKALEREERELLDQASLGEQVLASKQELADRRREVQQLDRQIQLYRDKMDRAREVSETKRQRLEEVMVELRKQYQMLVAERNVRDRELEETKAKVARWEAKTEELRRQFAVEQKETRVEMERLNAHLREYLVAMRQRVDEDS